METLTTRPIWQLLLAEPSNLTCDECFAVMEYCFEMLGNDRDVLFPIVEKYLENCPIHVMERHLAFYREMASVEDEHDVPRSKSFEHSQSSIVSHPDTVFIRPSSNDHSESLSHDRVRKTREGY